MFVQISNILKVCVQNVLHMLECNLKDVDRFIDEQVLEIFPLVIRCDISGSMSRIRLRYTRSCSLPQIL